jgi:hypothetical protein
MKLNNAAASVLGALVIVAGCEPDITVCELPEELNTCEDDNDCLLAYCGVNCCPCEVVASREQFEETYCMVDIVEGFDRARTYCEEARDTVCDGVDCIGTPCPHPRGAACDGGQCVAVY